MMFIRCSALLQKSYLFRRNLYQSKRLDKVVPFMLADIGEGITEVEVLEWHVKEGAMVKQFDKIAEVQSDKATVDITSRYDGVVKKRHYAKGAIAKVGAPLVDIEVEGKEEQEDGKIEEKQQGKEAMLKREKEKTRGIIEIEEVQTTTGTLQTQKDQPNTELDLVEGLIKAMPGVRHFARSQNVDLNQVVPTGKAGQVTKEDILKHKKLSPKNDEKMTMNDDKQLTTSKMDPNAFDVVTLNAFQKTMVKSMQVALSIPHFGYHDEIIFDQIANIRKGIAEMVEQKYKVKLTPMSFYIKALSMALNDFPQLNSHYDPVNNAIKRFKSHNICVAVDAGHGLAIPVIKTVQEKSIIDIASELGRLIEAARANRLSPSDLGGGTITISNIGAIGGTTANPVIVPPQVAIVALGRAQLLPRFNEHATLVVGKQIMPISWSADHRVIDGATIARFSQKWKWFLENPSSIFLG